MFKKYFKRIKRSYFGFLKGTVRINDDIVNCSFESDWEISND